jgi:hypothetical protein
MCAENSSMDIVSMETNVTSDITRQFALITNVKCLNVKEDILENVDGTKNTEGVNLQLIVRINMRMSKMLIQ